MAETTTDLSMVKGDDFSRTLTIKTNGVAQDITGWTIYFTIKENVTEPDTSAVYQQIVTTHTNPTGGVTTITIPHASSELFDVTSYLYDIQTVTDANIVSTPVRGTFEVYWEITDTE